jgi:hypothetical protein
MATAAASAAAAEYVRQGLDAVVAREAEGAMPAREAAGGTVGVMADTGDAAPLDRAAKQKLRQKQRDKKKRKSKRRH